jgi:3-deoxy-D-manno-octulosonic-acid transferase
MEAPIAEKHFIEASRLAVIYRAYNVVFTLAFVLVLPFVPLIFLLGERFRRGLRQRLGFYSREVRAALGGARPIWIHAVSVGEVLSAGSLTDKLKERFPGRKIVVSTGTFTGNQIARQATAADLVVFFPLDHPWIARRAMRAIDPSILIFLETEIWPNLLRLAYRKGVPTLLLSGRLSFHGLKKYLYFGIFFKKVIGQFTVLGMQTDADAERIAKLGVEPGKIFVTGSLKHAPWKGNGSYPAVAVVRTMEPEPRRGQILVVGSTHRGEEEVFLDVFSSLKKDFPDLEMVLAPRHPQRFQEVERLLRARGMPFEKKSQMNGAMMPEGKILLLDTIGDLLSFYAVSDVAFVGGSLVDAGGHNLLEPARFRKAILFGSHMGNFHSLAREMIKDGGGIEVSGREDLVREISGLLRNPEKARRMGEIAYRIAADDRGVVERSLELVCRYLRA